jgi:hypothetical protein
MDTPSTPVIGLPSCINLGLLQRISKSPSNATLGKLTKHELTLHNFFHRPHISSLKIRPPTSQRQVAAVPTEDSKVVTRPARLSRYSSANKKEILEELSPDHGRLEIIWNKRYLVSSEDVHGPQEKRCISNLKTSSG